MIKSDINKSGAGSVKGTAPTQSELQEIRKELKAEAEKLKALEIRVGAIEQNLLGN